jgi:hypothetical protein
MSTTTSTTHVLSAELIESLALVGKIVHIEGRSGQFKVHSVEGRDWYAFDRDGETVVDLAMTPASWIQTPWTTVVPVGHRVGEGFSEQWPVGDLVRGVNLVKGW